MKNFLLFLFLLMGSTLIYAQLDNSLLYTPQSDTIIKKTSGFGFHINNVNYVRNTEFHSSNDLGATWAGSQIWPELMYRFNKELSFKTGLFLQKDIGNNKLRPVIPTYTLTYQLKQLKINFGTIEGSLDHNLIEPLYSMENFIDKRLENGLQFKGKQNRLNYDVWIDWEKMIYKTSTHPEQFTVGISSVMSLVNKTHFEWRLPIQVMARHQGGEIYKYPHSNIKSQYNFAYGTQFKVKMPDQFIDRVDLQGYLTFYEDGSPSKADSFRDGTGHFVALTLGMNHLSVMLNYWEAHQYIAPLGEAILSSSNRSRPGDFIQYRKAVMLRLMYEIPLSSQSALVARMNNNYDLAEKRYNNVIELYFRFNIGNPIGRRSKPNN